MLRVDRGAVVEDRVRPLMEQCRGLRLDSGMAVCFTGRSHVLGWQRTPKGGPGADGSGSQASGSRFRDQEEL